MLVRFSISGIAFEAGGDFIPGAQGCLTLPNGDPGYPDEDAEFHIQSLTVNGVDAMWLMDNDGVSFRFATFADGRVWYKKAGDVVSDAATSAAVKQAIDDAQRLQWEARQSIKEVLEW